MSSQSVAHGFYGKIPARGDFVQKGLPRDFVQAWDAWMVNAMAHSRTALGGTWAEGFMTAPVWRFLLGAGICGEGAVAGVMVPSVDRVGREFPLVLARIGTPLPRVKASPLGATWFEAAEALALDVLESVLEPEAIMARLDEALLPPTGPEVPGMRRRDSLDDPASPLAGLRLDALMAGGLGGFDGIGIWWTEGSDLVEPSVLSCPAMPDVSGFPAMLVGNWGEFGWNDEAPIPEEPA